MCFGDTKISLEEQKDTFYNIVSKKVNALIVAEVMATRGGKPVTLHEMKVFLLQLEPTSNNRVWQKKRCFRCDGYGHDSNNCKWKAEKKWFCYYCRTMKSYNDQIARTKRKGQ